MRIPPIVALGLLGVFLGMITSPGAAILAGKEYFESGYSVGVYMPSSRLEDFKKDLEKRPNSRKEAEYYIWSANKLLSMTRKQEKRMEAMIFALFLSFVLVPFGIWWLKDLLKM